MTLDFRKPARMDDLLTSRPTPELGGASLVMGQRVLRDDRNPGRGRGQGGGPVGGARRAPAAPPGGKLAAARMDAAARARVNVALTLMDDSIRGDGLRLCVSAKPQK